MKGFMLKSFMIIVGVALLALTVLTWELLIE
jgi:hypothetical protein